MQHGLRFLGELDVETLPEFRATWRTRNLASLKRLECLRAFFRFCFESGWVSENPAKKTRNPEITDRPTMPFSQDGMIRIYAACDKYTDSYRRTGQARARRLKAVVCVLRHSGLRMRDALTLSRDRIVDGKLFLCTASSGTRVCCLLAPFVLEALDAAARSSQYSLWTGESKPESAASDWRRSLGEVFELAEITDEHRHRFRDTLAIELLLAGVPLERVSVLLGHQSLNVAEKHYAPWIRARQEELEANIRRTWGMDQVMSGQTKGTPEDHAGREVVN